MNEEVKQAVNRGLEAAMGLAGLDGGLVARDAAEQAADELGLSAEDKRNALERATDWGSMA